jgi:hypothetical protein|tara:strand:+ start:166 stop:345 length:180 start_codon:yes stop_codon:yes gene_type:complete
VAQLTQQLVEVVAVVKVQVMDLEHQQVENQEDLAEVQVLQLVVMKLEEQELHVKVMLVE